MKKLIIVRPEDFDVETLRAASQEGRLYIEESRTEVSREQIKKEVRAYVARIWVYASRKYRSSVDEIWEQILSRDEFMDILTPGSKARKCQLFNKYHVMRIIGVLRENGVYEQYSDRKYSAQLELTDKDNSYRSYLGMGLEDRKLLLTIRQIVAELEL